MKKKLFLIIGGVTVAFLFWLGYQTSLRRAQYLSQPYRQWLSVANFKFKAMIANVADAVYPQTYWHNYYARQFKTFNLLMSSADIKNIKKDARQSVEFGYTAKEAVNTQQIALLFEGKQYPASISFHGGGANDFVFNKNDYNIKIEANQAVANYSAFNLFNPSVHSWLVPLLAGKVAAQLNLYVNDQFPVLVKINNKTSGVYLLEEKINENFLAKLGEDQGQVIKLRDETRLPHRVNTVALDAHILSGLDFAIANVDPLKQDSEAVLYRLDQFYKAIESQNFDQISQFIDLDYWARFDAYRELLAIDHDTAGANFIMFYSKSTGKFYPIARSEGELNRLSISGGTTLRSFNNYDPHLAKQYDYPRVFLRLNLEPQFRLLKYRYLNQLLNKSDELIKEFESVYDQYAPVLLFDTSDEASAWEKKKLFKGYRQTIFNNLAVIKQELEFAQVAINVINKSGQTTILEIIPDALVPIKFDVLELEFADGTTLDVSQAVNDKTIIAAITTDLNLVPTTYSFSFPTRKPTTSLRIKAKNQITGSDIDKIFTAVASDNSPAD